MACKLATNFDLIFGILTGNLPEDTIDVGLKVCTLWGIQMYKDRSTQVIMCSPWRTKVKPFPSLQRKMMEYLRCRQTIAIPFANRSYQPRPKATPIRSCNLVTLTRPNREKLSQPRKVNCRALSSSDAEELACHSQGKKSGSCNIKPGPHTYQASRTTSYSITYLTLIS